MWYYRQLDSKENNLLNLDVVKSISSNDDDILLGIMRLHNDGDTFDIDKKK